MELPNQSDVQSKEVGEQEEASNEVADSELNVITGKGSFK
jgi:hypothetical protein